MRNSTARAADFNEAALSETSSGISQIIAKRQPGGFGGWTGQKYRPSKATGSTKAVSDNELGADGQPIAETNIRTTVVEGESYTVSEDGCLVGGYVVSTDSPTAK